MSTYYNQSDRRRETAFNMFRDQITGYVEDMSLKSEGNRRMVNVPSIVMYYISGRRPKVDEEYLKELRLHCNNKDLPENVFCNLRTVRREGGVVTFVDIVKVNL